MNRSIFFFLIAILVCSSALAQNNAMDTMSASESAATDATKAYMAAMQKMDKGMDIPYTGDADADLVRGMIPHHQGAVDMCKVELQYGKDAEIQKLCRNIVASQETQIIEMKKWLQRHNQ